MARAEIATVEVVTARFQMNMLKIRKEKGLTQTTLAKRIGCAVGYVSQLEAGVRDPSIEMIAKVAKGLGVDPQEMLAP
jgi:transcriptional regulator with XRE-family HTH domain